jgi:hypothetical protein
MFDALLSLIAQAGPLDEATSWTTFLKDAGGWGVSVIEFGVIMYMWRTFREDLKSKDDKIISVLEKQNDVIRGLKGGA